MAALAALVLVATSQRYTIRRRAKDKSGNVVSGATALLFNSATYELVDSEITDSGGWFEFDTTDDTTEHFVVVLGVGVGAVSKRDLVGT